MGLVKCPRCELNYMPDNQKVCNICSNEIYGKETEPSLGICPECDENPVIPGKELCLFCLREKKRQESIDALEPSITEKDLTIDGASELEEIEIDSNGDIPENELEEIDEELGGSKNEDDMADEDDDYDGKRAMSRNITDEDDEDLED